MKIKYQGSHIASVFSVINIESARALIQNQIGEDVDVSLIELEPETDRERVGLIRKNIAINGDTDSLLGTTSDSSNLLLVEFSKLIMALDSVITIEDVKQTAASFKQEAETLLSKIDTNEYCFPYMQKGQNEVLLEVGQRATAVNNALFKHTVS